MSDSLASSSSGSDGGSSSDPLCSAMAADTRLWTAGDLCMSMDVCLCRPLGLTGVAGFLWLSSSSIASNLAVSWLTMP